MALHLLQMTDTEQKNCLKLQTDRQTDSVFVYLMDIQTDTVEYMYAAALPCYLCKEERAD